MRSSARRRRREPIGKPIEQGWDGAGEAVVRAMNGARLPGLIEDELLLGPRLVVRALGMPRRYQMVVLAVDDEERTRDLVDHALERKGLQALAGVVEVFGSGEPAELVADGRIRVVEIHAIVQGAEDRAGAQALIERRRPGRIVAAEAPADEGDPLGIDLGSALEIIDRRAYGDLVIVAAHELAMAKGLALARHVDHQQSHAALDRRFPTEEVELLLQHVGPGNVEQARGFLAAGMHGRVEVAG